MILDELACFNTWSERFNYLIERSEEHNHLPADERTPQNRIDGCTSTTYLKVTLDKQSHILIDSYSNASIPFALTCLLRDIYNGLSINQVRELSTWYSRPIGDNPTPLIDALTPARSIAFLNMIKKISLYL